jgi:hypothetical protein
LYVLLMLLLLLLLLLLLRAMHQLRPVVLHCGMLCRQRMQEVLRGSCFRSQAVRPHGTASFARSRQLLQGAILHESASTAACPALAT